MANPGSIFNQCRIPKDVLKKADLCAPVDPAAAMVGKTFQFETVDLDGNKVTSDELFANNEVTMINYWGTSGHKIGIQLELQQ